jgi:hypothetical protein
MWSLNVPGSASSQLHTVVRQERPLAPGRKARAATAAQVRAVAEVGNFLGRHLRNGAPQLLVSALLLVHGDVAQIEFPDSLRKDGSNHVRH